MNKSLLAILLPVSFVLLIWLSWYYVPVLAFAAFIPLIVVMRSEIRPVARILLLWLLLLAWNIVVTGWLCRIHFFKGMGVFVINSIVMLLSLMLGLFCKKRLFAGRETGWIAVLVVWLAYEYLQFVWDMSWPWLSIGNVFAKWPALVQWYSLTGMLGGSVWVLLINYGLYRCGLQFFQKGRVARVNLYWQGSILVLPCCVSWLLYTKAPPADSRLYNVAMISTNYHDSLFVGDAGRMRQVGRILGGHVDSSTDLVIIPELFLDDVSSSGFYGSDIYVEIKKFTRWGKKLKALVGATLVQETPNGTQTREYFGQHVQVNTYNVAIMVDSSNHIPVKQKKVFIPFEEHIPSFLPFVNYSSESYSFSGENQDSFSLGDSTAGFLNLICYEAVNGVYVAGRIRKDDQFIVMLASEAFFGKDSPGMVQYLNYCRLRCIETGKFLIKDSNEGISAVINDKGCIIAEDRSKEYHLLKTTIPGRTGYTFYSQFGDLIGPFSAGLTGIFVLGTFLAMFVKRPQPDGDFHPCS